MEIPNTKRIEVKETIHGVEIIDPYRWLENFDDPKVQEWLEIQHKYTEEILNHIPNRKEAIERIKELLSLGEITAPKKKRNKLFFEKRTKENQPILYVQYENGEEKKLIDPNQLSEDNPVALDWHNISPHANLIAYGLSQNGDEWSILHIKKIDTGEILEERIPRTRHCNISWLSDESGFYYTRFPEPGTVPKGEENYNQKIYFHKIGTDWHSDKIIFGEGRKKTNHYSSSITDDNRYLLIRIHQYSRNELYLLDIENNYEEKEIITDQDALTFGQIMDDYIWLLTNRNHPNKAIYKTKITKPHYNNWELVVDEKKEESISETLISQDKIFCKVRIKAADYINIYSLEGKFLSQIKLPEFSSIFGLTSFGLEICKDDTFFFGLRSFFYPTNIYKYDIQKNQLTLFAEISSPIDPDNYIVKQIWYESKDKTKVSMFIAHKKEIKYNGNNPTLLCGYGGFNIAIQPPYLRYSRFYWLEKGGIIAIANLRGGSEYGEEWHKAGMLENKQNVFDDFIHAGLWLIENKFTSKENLGIFGRSNGGLLTGAAVTQRPDLFGAVYIAVPLLDMLRYHLFSIARYWIPEYGSSEDPEQFKFIYKYSPYHNVKKGTHYPTTFLVTAASDSRVDANHAMKMTALMQWANVSKEPIMLFVERQAGHGIGKPLEKLAITEADFYTFIGWKTGLEI